MYSLFCLPCLSPFLLSRLVHEAFQFLMAKKKKKTGRSMTENWSAVGGKASLLKAGKLGKKTPEVQT